MLEFRIDVDIQAPPDRVWEVIRDVARWPEWTPTVTTVHLLDAGPLAVGSRAAVRQPKLLPAKWQVVELDDEKRSFTWITRSPGVQVAARHWVEPDGDASKASLSLEFSGPLAPLFARMTRNLNERYLELEANGLRTRCEALST